MSPAGSKLSLRAVVALLVVAALCCGADVPPDAAKLFKARGLSVGGGLLISSRAEADVHEAARKVRVAKAKIAGEAASIRDADASVDRAQSNLDSLRGRWSVAAADLAAHPKDNLYVGRHNALYAQVGQAEGVLRVAMDRRQRISDVHAAYVTMVVSAVATADAANANYHALAGDATVNAALASYNLTAHPTITLGPSPAFNTDVATITASAKDAAEASIAVDNSRNVPILDVVFANGVHRRMMWDSGASSVSLSAPAAQAGGIRIAKDDPTVSIVTAEGRTVKARAVIAESLRVGPFTVRNVPCVVMPADLGDVDCLVGGTFQSHFIAKVELHRGRLTLTPLDADVAVTGDLKATADAEKPANADDPLSAALAARETAAGAVDSKFRSAILAADQSLSAGLDRLHEAAVRSGDGKVVTAVDEFHQKIKDRIDAGEPDATAFGYTDWRFCRNDMVRHITRASAGRGDNVPCPLRWESPSVAVARWKSGWVDRFTMVDGQAVFSETWKPEHRDAALSTPADDYDMAFPFCLRAFTTALPKDSGAVLATYRSAGLSAHDVRMAGLATADQRLLAALVPLIDAAGKDNAPASLTRARTEAQARLNEERPPRFRLASPRWAFRHSWMPDSTLTLNDATAQWVGHNERVRIIWQGNVAILCWPNAHVDRITFMNGCAYMQSWPSAQATMDGPAPACGFAVPAK